MRSNQLVWIGVIVLLIGGAIFGYRTISNWADGPIPDDKSSASPFMCANPDCKHVDLLTDRDFDRMKHATMLARQQATSEGKSVPAGRRQIPILQCPKCKQFNFRPACKCRNDGEIFVYHNEDLTPNKCPKCGAVAGMPPKAPGG